MGRESIFSDDRIIELLTRDFVPVALDNQHTQYRKQHDELYQYVWRILDQSNFREINAPFDSAQGYYTFNAEGKLYGYTNDSCAIESISVRESGPVLDLIQRARSMHEKDASAHARPPQPDSGKEAVQTQPAPPADSVVLAVYARVKPIPAGADPVNGRIGRDFLWVYRRELDELLQGEFPEDLAMRLSRFHLVDDVRGLPSFWDVDHVKRASFRAELLPGDGTTLVVRLHGEFSMLAAARKEEGKELPETGYEGTLEGEIVYDRTRSRVESFRVYAEGQAWGYWENTEHAPDGKFPLKVAMVLDGGTLARQIAPGAVSALGVDAYTDPSRGE